MVNFDDILSKAKSAAEVAGKKTGEFVEISKLKLNSMQLASDLKSAYEKLGELTYYKVKAGVDFPKDMLDFVEGIEDINHKITDVNEKISTIKKIKLCPECSWPNSIDADYCNKCGKELD